MKIDERVDAVLRNSSEFTIQERSAIAACILFVQEKVLKGENRAKFLELYGTYSVEPLE